MIINDKQDVYKIIGESNQNRQFNVLIVFDEMIAGGLSNENLIY